MGYKTIQVNNKQVRLHRYLMEQEVGRKLGANEIVHHKDGDIRNNSIENLEIVSRSRHAQMHDAYLLSRRRPVVQKTKKGKVVKVWSSGREIKKMLGYENSNICKCCKGIIKSSYGYFWEYENA